MAANDLSDTRGQGICSYGFEFDSDNEYVLLPCSGYIDTSNHTHSVNHYWHHLEYNTLDKHPLQTGPEAMVYVPQYLLNKVNVKWS